MGKILCEECERFKSYCEEASQVLCKYWGYLAWDNWLAEHVATKCFKSKSVPTQEEAQ